MKFKASSKKLMNSDGTLVHQQPSRHSSSYFKPTGIIVHDTAGHLRKFGTGEWFGMAQAKAASHFGVERDGTVMQYVDLDRAAWHAGRSSYKGRRGVSSFAFGIEIVNPGRMTPVGPNKKDGMSWFKHIYRDTDYGGPHKPGHYDLEYAKTPNHGGAMWMHYTPEQIESTLELCMALKEKFPINFLTTHWYISPGRKVDTNPPFPLEEVRGRLFGREEPEQKIIAKSGPGNPLDADATVVVNTSYRHWPNPKSTAVGSIGKGARVNIVKAGMWDDEVWFLCEVNNKGDGGWIHGPLVDLDD